MYILSLQKLHLLIGSTMCHMNMNTDHRLPQVSYSANSIHSRHGIQSTRHMVNS